MYNVEQKVNFEIEITGFKLWLFNLFCMCLAHTTLMPQKLNFSTLKYWWLTPVSVVVKIDCNKYQVSITRVCSECF